MLKQVEARILVLILICGALTACVASHSQTTGITVDSLRQPEITEWKECGEVAMVLVEVGATPEISSKYRRIFSEKAKATLAETPYFKMREMVDKKAWKGVTEVVAAHHFLEFRINMLDIRSSAGRKELDIGITAHLKKQIGDSYIKCGVKEFTDDYVWQGDNLPSKNIIVSKALQKSLQRLIGMIAPQRISVYRAVKKGSGEKANIASLLDNGNCELAKQTASEYLQNHGQDQDVLYNLAVAYECLASQNRKLENKLKYLREAKHFYYLYLKQNNSDEDAQLAIRHVIESIKLYKLALEKEVPQSGPQIGEEEFQGVIN